uniref:Cyclin-dependent kinase inhibitor domain-containing protein n=1 Tax=Anopheles epiroticus TaxID=199890 RepID=A0A182PBX1_9DIPT
MGAQVYNQTIERLHYSPVPPPVKSYKRHSPAKSLLNRTKRQLFGKVEPTAYREYVESHMRQVSEEKMKKWNFDFTNDKPIDGPLQWEPMGRNRVPVVTLTAAAHVISGTAGVRRQNSSSSSSSSISFLSSDELMDERAERANRDSSIESHNESLSSNASTLSPAEVEEQLESVQTYPILPCSPKKTSSRSQSPKPSSSKGSKLRQPQITEFLKERKRRLSTSTVVSAKKVRMMLAASSSSNSGCTGEQQQEASTSSAN